MNQPGDRGEAREQSSHHKFLHKLSRHAHASEKTTRQDTSHLAAQDKDSIRGSNRGNSGGNNNNESHPGCRVPDATEDHPRRVDKGTQQAKASLQGQSTAVRRLIQELRTLREKPIAYVRAEPIPSNLFVWTAQIQGAPDTPYYGGLFKLSIAFPADYPFRPPAVKFDTRVYHPNISNGGAICVDILKPGVWSPALSIQALLLALLSLLETPNPDDPLRPDAAVLLKTDPAAYRRKVRSYVRKYAKTSDSHTS